MLVVPSSLPSLIDDVALRPVEEFLQSFFSGVA
jgi:hypothetical protein